MIFDSRSDHAYSDLFNELWSICRSISGQGLRDSLAIFARYMPLEIEGVASGTQVFDRTGPLEWTIRSATLTGPDAKVVADMAVNNLHVLNYSEPVDKLLPLEELQGISIRSSTSPIWSPTCS
jgi:aminopeptidase-like protein